MTIRRSFGAALILGALAALAPACSASFVGPATDSSGERCKGHLDCGASGCCPGLPDDGWECNPPGARTVCSFTGAGIGPGDPYSAKARPDAGAR